MNAPPPLDAAALRYLSGEMSPDEAAAFEASLAEDANAPAALADAVLVWDALRPDNVPELGRRTNDGQLGSSLRRFTVLATAAALLLLVGVTLFVPVGPAGTPAGDGLVQGGRTQDGFVSEDRLLPLWVDLAEVDLAGEPFGPSFPSDASADFAGNDVVEDAAAGAGDDDAWDDDTWDTDTPDWLYAAVSLPDDLAPDTLPGGVAPDDLPGNGVPEDVL